MSQLSHVPCPNQNRESTSFLLVRPQTCHHHHTCSMSQSQSFTGPSYEGMSNFWEEFFILTSPGVLIHSPYQHAPPHSQNPIE